MSETDAEVEQKMRRKRQQKAARERQEEVVRMACANAKEKRSIDELSQLVKHGAHFIDVRVRAEGREHVFEADWLRRLLHPSPYADCDSADRVVAEHARELSLERELESLLNRHSAENASDTPDFILATYLMRCLDAFNAALQHRERLR